MPNIPQYEIPTQGLQPSEIGVESTARAAVRVAAFGNQEASDLQRVGQEIGSGVKSVGDVALQYMEHREINTAAPHAATIVAAKDQQWNDFVTGKDIDPNDPNRQDIINSRINNPQMAQQWRQQNLDPDLDQFQGAFTTKGGQDWAQRWADTYRDHFDRKANSDQSQMAGAVVQANIERTSDTMATAVFNDPSTLGQSFDLLSHSIEGNVRSSPTMTPDMATKVQTELQQHNEEKLVQAAIQGAILKGGDWRSIATDPKYSAYVKPAENAQFDRMEKFYQRGAEASEKQSLLLSKQIAETNAAGALNKSWAANVKFDAASGRPTIGPQFFKDMTELPLRNPNAPNATELAKTYLDWGERMQKPEKIVTDQATASDLDGRMFAADNPTTETQVLRAEADGKMSTQDGQIRRELIKARDAEPIKDPQFKYAVDGAKQAIEGTTAGEKMLASGKFAGFMQNFLGSYLRQSRSGTLPPNALDLNDPESLISKTIAPYKSPLAGIIQSNGGVGTVPAAAPAAPKPAPAQVNDKAAYDRLPPGAVFTHGGKQFVKPGAATIAPGQT